MRGGFGNDPPRHVTGLNPPGGAPLFKLFRRSSDRSEPTLDFPQGGGPDPLAPQPVAVAQAGAELPAGNQPELPEPEPLPDVDDVAEEEERTQEAVERTKRVWFRRVAGIFDRTNIGDDLWDELEEILLGADTGLATTERILDTTRSRIHSEGIREPAQAREILKQELVAILEDVDVKGQLWDTDRDLSRKPAVILVIGVNGVGKTTSIAKLAAAFKRDGERVLIAAGDTFRAAAIEQLKLWGERIDVEVVASQPGADPAAIVYDTIAAAQGRGADVVVVDTAGRLHTKFNLMEELAKIRRTAGKLDPEAPHEVLLVLDATTGQNGLTQAKTFAQAVGVTSIFLTKLDGTAKGGIVFSICDQLHIPVRFIGTGERAADVALFDPVEFVDALFA